MTNLFAAKLSSILSARLDPALIYDDTIKLFGPGHNAPELQLKSLFGMGLLVKIQPSRVSESYYSPGYFSPTFAGSWDKKNLFGLQK